MTVDGAPSYAGAMYSSNKGEEAMEEIKKDCDVVYVGKAYTMS